MKKTSEKILNTALALFNSYGLPKVTLRTIAKEMGISQGNLNYHYKKRDDIIEALYFQLVEMMDKSMEENQPSSEGLQLMFDISAGIMSNSYKYRFFLLDFAQIMRENATIKKHFKKLTELRQEQFSGLINMMVALGIMRKEKLPNEYFFLYQRFQLLGDFWISSAEIAHTKITKKIMSEYYEIITQAIYPYLTAKGVKEYHTIVSG